MFLLLLFLLAGMVNHCSLTQVSESPDTWTKSSKNVLSLPLGLIQLMNLAFFQFNSTNIY